MTIARRVIDQLYTEQGGVCAICNRKISDFHIHHAIYTRNKKFSKYLDVAENLVALCHKCHANHGWLSKFETRKKAWKFKVEQGYDMKAWHDSIPMIVKDKLDA